MSQHPPSASTPETSQESKRRFRLLLIGCIGVVYGDIGTSPLYAFRAAAQHVMEGGIDNGEILGIISLILWALIITVTIKYVLFLTRIDNRGEGGILALAALAQAKSGKRIGVLFLAAIAGVALFFGEAAVTPAIAVLSAMEGLTLLNPAFEQWVMPIAMVILVCLFMVQRFGTERVAAFYGPITTLWLLILGGAGIYWIFQNPVVLLAFSPHYALTFIASHGVISFFVLGSIFLAVTGAEALYTDLGHFGRKPIKTAWLYLVFPCLALNYMGQGALLMATPSAIDNSFYLMFPAWALLPMVGMATLATVIASQAVITGAYSACRQAIQLGLLPRLDIKHTSATHEGQIYMPQINLLLMLAVLFLCLVFRDADSLAAAYGIAVCGTMIATSVIVFFVIARVWNKGAFLASLIIAPFLLIEIAFFTSNLLKLLDGAFVPLIFGLFIMLMIITWVQGTRYLVVKARRQAISMEDMVEMLERDPPHIVPGTAIFLTSDFNYAPETMVQNLNHNQVLHEKNVIVTVVIKDIPRVPFDQRVDVTRINKHFLRVIVYFGFMETPHVPAALNRARNQGHDIDIEHASFFIGHRKIIADPKKGLPMWQDRIYLAMNRNAADATDHFHIPPNQVVEIGMRQIV